MSLISSKERINGEILTGIALVILSLLFIFAGSVNEVWAIILPGDYLILILGLAFIALGVVSIIRRKNLPEETSTHHH
jgi:putative Ca2+/H+ antiporter (TMEM165/GDT1 family)